MINFEEIELNALNAVNKNCLPYEEAALYNTKKLLKPSVNTKFLITI